MTRCSPVSHGLGRPPDARAEPPSHRTAEIVVVTPAQTTTPARRRAARCRSARQLPCRKPAEIIVRTISRHTDTLLTRHRDPQAGIVERLALKVHAARSRSGRDGGSPLRKHHSRPATAASMSFWTLGSSAETSTAAQRFSNSRARARWPYRSIAVGILHREGWRLLGYRLTRIRAEESPAYPPPAAASGVDILASSTADKRRSPRWPLRRPTSGDARAQPIGVRILS